MKIDSLPSQYEPFNQIEIGTNSLTNVEVLFSLNDNVPLLIGFGKEPRIWLSIPADPKGGKWQKLVRDSKSLHPKVKVIRKDGSIVIDTPDGAVLNVKKLSETMVKVVLINLRPFGINIHGDENSLMVMNSNLVGNSFVNVKVMVGIGGGSKQPNKGVEPTS